MPVGAPGFPRWISTGHSCPFLHLCPGASCGWKVWGGTWSHSGCRAILGVVTGLELAVTALSSHLGWPHLDADVWERGWHLGFLLPQYSFLPLRTAGPGKRHSSSPGGSRTLPICRGRPDWREREWASTGGAEKAWIRVPALWWGHVPCTWTHVVGVGAGWSRWGRQRGHLDVHLQLLCAPRTCVNKKLPEGRCAH